MPLYFNSLFSFSAWQLVSKAHVSQTARASTRKNVLSVETKFKASAVCFQTFPRSLPLALYWYDSLRNSSFSLFQTIILEINMCHCKIIDTLQMFLKYLPNQLVYFCFKNLKKPQYVGFKYLREHMQDLQSYLQNCFQSKTSCLTARFNPLMISYKLV